MFEKYYKLKEHGTTIKTEVLAGITTFFLFSSQILIKKISF